MKNRKWLLTLVVIALGIAIVGVGGYLQCQPVCAGTGIGGGADRRNTRASATNDPGLLAA